MLYAGGAGYEVEFMTLVGGDDGDSFLCHPQLHPIVHRGIVHARNVGSV